MQVSIMTEQKIQIPAHIQVRERHGERMLYNLHSGEYFSLDESAIVMWNVFSSSSSLQEALERLKTALPGPEQELAEEVQSFAQELAENGLLELQDA